MLTRALSSSGGGNGRYKYDYLGNGSGISQYKINLGFKPRAILIKCNVISGGNNWSTYDYYDEEVSPTQAKHSANGTTPSNVNIGSSGCIIYSIDNDSNNVGFTLGFGSAGTDLSIAYYVTYLAVE